VPVEPERRLGVALVFGRLALPVVGVVTSVVGPLLSVVEPLLEWGELTVGAAGAGATRAV
jgi:hypothetical protein